MNVTRKEQRIIQRALKAWQASGELTPSDSQRLAQTMRVSPFDWRRLSRYAFWTALACVLISLGSLFADSELVAWLLSLFSHSALMRILLPALLALCYGAQSLLRQRQLFTVSKAMGLTYLFIALWIMSIFGNYDADSWYQVSQARLLPWGLLFAVAAGVCIFISLKTDDGMLRGFGLTFLAINLYTRFFEFFWNGMHKVLFFLILAVSLAVIGRYAERIWHAGNVKP
ncbi:TPA: hypothetical protein MDX62_002933 [Klebsiella pneumoniae]|uniref:hypothetical protein n=1 Tax=Klebsiella pneumoniae TaxID=573 RepID=UPI00108277C8|nr:hypothetical protein [Klebsiella pneumoniae]EKP0842675.1 hypothetical protein [Klebsiella pneumoniae]EKQ6495479.1 hypothetical protein [Klebsiella pneumoniae]EKS0498870.1 hypothetical protein [Klebsiella pneumoniae]EKV8556455.1 hypothetical protein [Klebsiella pneumoniae]EKV9297228.1 hypothetical protein [Klebsiella pneumoniae]